LVDSSKYNTCNDKQNFFIQPYHLGEIEMGNQSFI